MFTGTILNALGILIGGTAGLTLRRQFSQPTQLALRGVMGVLTVFIGLRLCWVSFSGGFMQRFKEFVVLLLALTAGRMIGRLLRVQESLNRLGQFASQRYSRATPGDPNRFNEGFLICSVLFCAGPLGPLGAVVEGLAGHWEPLGIKTVMDGLAAVGLVGVYGWGAMLWRK